MAAQLKPAIAETHARPPWRPIKSAAAEDQAHPNGVLSPPQRRTKPAPAGSFLQKLFFT